ncbi:pheromone-processing carboxypeptidase KEX1 [Rhizoctonia solani AG-3 Rhs1AP]|uniref:Pheromone-processing carboxypeptidase KEX1 n=1 Tax=Rhizoctonia solani AG-3 Rhs1AP TaxID=1086054 RepID=X8J3S9_9AGAM|nr:pheromone-processing carboxypeptidase KEX1 [Rhizoctonia solani AG-3 Rhs1AP]
MRFGLLVLGAIGLVGAAPAPPSAASFYVKQLPGLNIQHTDDHPLHVYAGHLLSDPKTPSAEHSKDVQAHLYFVYTKARRTADRERVIFWFNGGPGCSSFDGLMMEVGPWRIDGKGGLKLVENGWEEYTHVVYVDQPPGTGFSYASTDKYLHELDEAASHVVQFMKNFYAVFPELEEMDTYLSGESFAGQYIPYIADALLKTSSPSAPLRGIAIGNGWIDGRNQYPAYVDFAVDKGLIKRDSKEFVNVQKALDRCWKALNTTKSSVNIGDCETVMNSVTDALVTSVNGKKMCLNVYDIRLSDEYPACGMNWPPDLKDVYTYLRRKDVISALHATSKAEAWTECRGTVGQAFYTRTSPSAITLLPGLLERGVHVMLFNGDQDYICNYLGAERLIADLSWSGGKGMGNATTVGWSVNGTEAGWWRESRNMTYVKVAGASHMVPYDVPLAAHDMILRFMQVDFTKLSGGSATVVPSKLGDEVKPISAGLETGKNTTDAGTGDGKKNTEKDKAMWEAYYNAGSAALILVIILVFIGLFLYWRSRRSSKLGRVNLPTEQEQEERIPLSTNVGAGVSRDDLGQDRDRRGESEPIFDVGDDSGSEDGGKDRHRR